MPLATTTIGARPKPEYVRLPDWFTHPEGPDAADPTREWAEAMEALGEDAEVVIARGVAEAVEDAPIDAISIEDAHRPYELSLLERFHGTTVILGMVAIAKSRIEDSEEIAECLGAALGHIDAHRLVAAPDCGLGLLGRDLARSKLANLCRTARGIAGARNRGFAISGNEYSG